MEINIFLDLCSGISGGQLVLEQAGLKVQVIPTRANSQFVLIANARYLRRTLLL